jgi:hypothetical protein
VRSLYWPVCVICLVLCFATSAFARDARLDALVNQGIVTEEEIAAAEMEGPNTWMAKEAHDIYISGYVQPWAKYMNDADPDSAFGVHRARLKAAGSLGDNWIFVIEADFANNADLTDVGVGYNYGDGTIKMGQFKVPFLYENMTYSNMLDTIERSQFTSILYERDIGVFVDYNFLEGKVGVQAAVTNGEGANATEANDDKDYYVRVSGMPFQGSEGPADNLMIAGAYTSGSMAYFDDLGVDLGDYDGDAWVGTVSWTYAQFKVQGEYLDGKQDMPTGNLDGNAWYVYALYNMALDSMTVTPVVKYETIDVNLTEENGDWITLGVRISFVGIHDVKLEANYVLEDLDIGDDIDEFILQLTASF